MKNKKFKHAGSCRLLLALFASITVASCAPYFWIVDKDFIGYKDKNALDSIKIRQGTAFTDFNSVFNNKEIKEIFLIDSGTLTNVVTNGFKKGRGASLPWRNQMKYDTIFVTKSTLKQLKAKNPSAEQYKAKLKAIQNKKVKIFLKGT